MISKDELMRARELCFQFNTTNPKDTTIQHEILSKLIGKLGKNYSIAQNFNCDLGYNIEIGDDFFSNYNLVILDCAKITIGNNVFIAPNVGIYAATHPIHHERRNTREEWAYPITIGNNVWIGGNVVIRPGVTIGNNVVIGAGSVVTKDIPNGVLAYGNPCRIIREIGDDE